MTHCGVIQVLVAGMTMGCAAILSAADLTVGSGGNYLRIEDAIAVAAAGDVILVSPQPGDKPYARTHLALFQSRITIRAVNSKGDRVRLEGDGYDYSGQGRIPRAIVQFNKGADGCVIEGFELSGAHNTSHNGAGIRINQANQVTVRDCVIHRNDMGIMSNGDGTPQTAADQLIEDCLIHSNGDLTEPGYNHNLYLGGTSVTLRGCEVHSSLTGHNVKSRAHRTVVLGCYVHDSANREFDLVDDKAYTTSPGSDAVLAGNVIVKAAKCPGNRAVIHFGQDGGNDHDGMLTMVHNTIVTPFISPVIHLSSARARTRLFNTIVWDGGAGQKGQILFAAGKDPGKAQLVSGACNWLSSGFHSPDFETLPLQHTVFGSHGAILPFMNVGKGDLRLFRRDPTLVDQGCVLPPEVSQAIGVAILQYSHTRSAEVRPDDGKPDLGAYEFTAGENVKQP